MFANLLLALSFQVGPFYQQKSEYVAVRPFTAVENGETDVLWPVFTCHEDWWRFLYLVNYQDYHEDDGYQFSVVPFWFNGSDKEKGDYYGFFPFAGYHPHVGMMYDFKFGLWPLWHQYKMPRSVYRDGKREQQWMTSNAVLFPFFSWRDDGSWGFWPIYGVNHQRESDHRYALWPIVTWATYRDDRDTAGEGNSWMVWPLYGRVDREREATEMFLPPLFSYSKTYGKPLPGAKKGDPLPSQSTLVRCPWPFFTYESTPSRWHCQVWPFWERSIDIDYKKGEKSTDVTRFGWYLVELYDDEWRVFPFVAHGDDYTRVWPFWETTREPEKGVSTSRTLALFPIRWVPAVDRNWAKFWTFYENYSTPVYTDHSLLWGIIRWRSWK